MRRHGTYTFDLLLTYFLTASALTLDDADTVFFTPEDAVLDDVIGLLHGNVSLWKGHRMLMTIYLDLDFAEEAIERKVPRV